MSLSNDIKVQLWAGRLRRFYAFQESETIAYFLEDGSTEVAAIEGMVSRPASSERGGRGIG